MDLARRDDMTDSAARTPNVWTRPMRYGWPMTWRWWLKGQAARVRPAVGETSSTMWRFVFQMMESGTYDGKNTCLLRPSSTTTITTDSMAQKIKSEEVSGSLTTTTMAPNGKSEEVRLSASGLVTW